MNLERRIRQVLLAGVAMLIAACGSDPAEPKGPDVRATIESFEAVPPAIGAGETAELRWETTGATALELTDDEGARIDLGGAALGEGSVSISPTRTTTYTLRALPGGATAQAQVAVEVRPTILAFELLSEEPAEIGDEVAVRWETRDAQALTLSTPEGESVAILEEEIAEGSATIPVGASGKIRLTASSGSLEATAEVEVELRLDGAPTILSLRATPEVFTEGIEDEVLVTVEWETEGAERVALRANGTNVDLEGRSPAADQIEVAIQVATVFELEASNDAGSSAGEVSVRALPPASIISFTAPSRVASGASFVVSWSAEGASRIELDRDEELVLTEEGEEAGELEQQIFADTTYTLRAFNEAGHVTEAQLQVEVGPPAIRSFEVASPRIAPGGTVELSWETAGATTLEVVDEDERPVEGCATAEPAAIEVGGCTFSAPSELGTYTYELRIANDLEEEAASGVTIQVLDGPTILLFEAEPLRVTVEDFLTLRWEVESDVHGRRPDLKLRDDLEVEYELEDPEAGEATVVVVSAPGVRTFSLEASTPGTPSDSRAVEVEVLGLPTLELSASPEIFDEEPITLGWTSEHGASVAVYALDEERNLILPALFESEDPEVVASGSIEVVPAAPMTAYRVQIRNALGVMSQRTIEIPTLPVEILSFAMDPELEELVYRDAVDLVWSTKRATHVWTEPFHYGSDAPFVDIGESPSRNELVFADACDVPNGEPEFHGCASFQFPEGFTFLYDGVERTEAMVYVAGVLSFDTSTRGTVLGDLPFPAEASSHVHLAPYWRPLSLLPKEPTERGPGKVLFDLRQDEEGRYLVVQWKGLYLYSEFGFGMGPSIDDASEVDFQILLREDGNFDYRYRLIRAGGTDATLRDARIGFQDTSGSDGLLVVDRSFPAGGLDDFGYSFRPGGLATSGTMRVYPLGSGSYTLFASDGHTVDQRILAPVTVHPKADLVRVSFSPTAPTPGQQITLSWTVRDTLTVEVLDEDDEVICVPTGTATNCRFTDERGLEGEILYKLRLTGEGEGNVVVREVVVPYYHPPLIDDFTVSPDQILPGGTATLSWVTRQAQAIRLTAGDEELDVSSAGVESGMIQVSADERAEFTLTAINGTKTASDTIVLPVRTVRVESIGANRQQVKPGEAVELSWTTAGSGTISLSPADFLPISTNFQDISASGTPVALTTTALRWGKVDFSEIPGGFSFPYFGVPQSEVTVVANGWLGFGSSAASGGSERLTVGDVRGRHIVPFWDELTTYSVGDIYWQHFEDPAGDYLIIQWTKMQFRIAQAPAEGEETEDLNFQVVLFEDGSFEFRYGRMWSAIDLDRANGALAAIGFQDDSAYLGAEVLFRKPFPGGLEGRGWRYVPSTLGAGSATVRPTRTTDYRLCIEDETHRDCETVRVVVPSMGDLTISEVMRQPQGEDPSLQWFEVRNTSNDPIDVNGMTIRTNLGTHTIDAGGPLVIQPAAYMTFAASANPGFTPDYVYGTGLVLGVNEELSLETDGIWTTVARARWDEGWPFLEGRSLALDRSRHRPGRFSSTDPADWCPSTQTYGSQLGSPGDAEESCLTASLGYDFDAFARVPFIDISATGTKEVTFRGTASVAALPEDVAPLMPFFDGTARAEWISKNGVVGMGGSPHASATPRPIPSTQAPATGVVAPYWGSLVKNQGASILYERRTIGENEVFIVQWENWKRSARAEVLNEVSFQVQLWDNGDIAFVNRKLRGNAASFGAGMSVGIEAPGGLEGISYLYQEPLLIEGQSMIFRKK